MADRKVRVVIYSDGAYLDEYETVLSDLELSVEELADLIEFGNTYFDEWDLDYKEVILL